MAIDVSPRFTLSLRGYDKDEVDDYLESITARSSEAGTQLHEVQLRARSLESEQQRLLGRISELEEAIRSETPHTARALGERIAIILGEAEAGAEDALTQAKAHAEYLVAEARGEADTLRGQASMAVAQAEETLAAARREAEELAARLEAEAKARAAGVVTEAEGRARRRQDQIESWAQEVITRTQEEQMRMGDEFAALRRRHEATVGELLAQRDHVLAVLRSLQTDLAQAVERVPVATPLPAAEATSSILAVDHQGGVDLLPAAG